jgi:hypothetical protein
LPELRDDSRPGKSDIAAKFRCALTATGKNIDSVAVQHEVLPVRYVLDQRQPGLEPHIALFQLSPHAGLVILTQQPSDHAGAGTPS